VLARAAEVRTSIQEVLHALQVAPELLEWELVLKKYASLNFQVCCCSSGCCV
jgi:hypothetical protein